MSTKKRDPSVSRVSIKIADYRERTDQATTASVFATVALTCLAAGFFLAT
jgi:hypothetical protein